jgi:hypothetical protein
MLKSYSFWPENGIDFGRIDTIDGEWMEIRLSSIVGI